MLVQDDEATVEQSLRSVRGLIDYWVICDTGSQDRTSAIVTDVLAEIPGELHRREWVDFGYNRSELIELAREKADYLLLLEPDITLVRSGPVPELVDDAYVLREVGDDPANGVPRLVRGSRRWWYEGSTHEVLATNGRYSEAELDALAVERHIDETSRTVMLLRQLDILERDVAAGRQTPRTVFYLAQTLRDLGRFSAAIEWYRRRKELGDSDQETFYANFQEGVLRAREDFPAAVPILLEAWQRRPTRAEPLHELARNYLERGDAGLAHHFASLGLQMPEPRDAFLIHRWIYAWGLRFERGWAAVRLGRFGEADEDLRAVLETDGVPADFVAIVRNWLDDLAKNGAGRSGRASGGPTPSPLASLVDVRTGAIHLDVSPRWPTFNPSIAVDGDGFSMIVRSENVRYDRGDLRFIELPRGINYLVRLDAVLGVLGVDPIEDDPEDPHGHEARYRGFRDLRLIQMEGRWFAVGSSWERSTFSGHEVGLLELDGARVTRVHKLAGPDPGRLEKNWMPFVHGGELHLVYTCGPMVVFRYDRRTRGITLAAQSESPELASPFRGGSQGIALDGGGYLFVIHETYYEAGLRSYLHRFIRIGPDLRLSAVSRPFTFTDEVREFCAGAAIFGSELVLSFGVRHTEAWLAVVPLAGALDLLEPVIAS
jgi:tetratricopeptide (TPR) repeat protein